jgi:hypothetical protein
MAESRARRNFGHGPARGSVADDSRSALASRTTSPHRKRGGLRCSGVRQDAISVTAMAVRVKGPCSLTSLPAISEYPEIPSYSITTKTRPIGAAIALIRRDEASSIPVSRPFYARCKVTTANLNPDSQWVGLAPESKFLWCLQ